MKEIKNSEEKRKEKEKENKLLEEICEKYENSHKLNEKQEELIYNWGNALLYQYNILNNTKTKNESLLLEKLTQAKNKFESSFILSGNTNYKSLLNWAVVASKICHLKKIAIKNEGNFDEISKNENWDLKFKECEKIRNDDYLLYFNWGNALYSNVSILASNLNNFKNDNKKYGENLSFCYSILQQASQMFVRSIELKPSYLPSLYNWSKVLLYMISLKMHHFQSSSFLFSFELFIQVYLRIAKCNFILILYYFLIIFFC